MFVPGEPGFASCSVAAGALGSQDPSSRDGREQHIQETAVHNLTHRGVGGRTERFLAPGTQKGMEIHPCGLETVGEG